MIVPAWHVDFLKQPLSFWLATTNLDNIPEPIKCTGVLFEPQTDTFTCFVPLKFTKKALQDLRENASIALVGVELHTYEGYQYKGQYISYRDCTAGEVEYQLKYVKEFAGVLESFGYSGTGFYNAYVHPPFIAMKFQATQVFDQSPKKGAGGEIRNQS